LASDSGKALHLKGQGIVEPVFGQVKSNRGVAGSSCAAGRQ
jgi:hypothetical protein